MEGGGGGGGEEEDGWMKEDRDATGKMKEEEGENGRIQWVGR